MVPATLLVKEKEVVPPEQSACELGVAVIVGAGLTVTVTTIGFPEQPASVGVMVYITVPELSPVVVSVCEIDEPEPLDAPVTPDWEATQEYVVVPELLLSVIEVV